MAGMYPDNEELTIFGEKVQWPGVGASGKFTNGSFTDPLERPSFIPAGTINLILDNLSTLITKLGGAPNNTALDQLAGCFTNAPTANTGIMRDTQGRAQVAAPQPANDIARKAEVDAAKKYTDDLLIKIFQNGYIQWPWMPEPETVFYFKGYRWAEVNYDGCFFRAKGKGANPFDGDEQGEASRNITGYFHQFPSFPADGCFTVVQTGVQASYNTGAGSGVIYFDASKVVPTAEENRTRNRTFIIWKLEKI